MALTAEKSPITFWGANNHVFLSNLAGSKRRTQNTRSGTRVPNAGGVYSGFWRPEASQSYFCSFQKGSAVSHRVFQQFSNSSWTSVNSTTKKCERSEHFFFKRKKDPGRTGQHLFCFTQKRIRSWEDQLSGDFIHHFEPIRALKILFYLEGKFQCPGHGNTLTLDCRKKRNHSERAFQNASS